LKQVKGQVSCRGEKAPGTQASTPGNGERQTRKRARCRRLRSGEAQVFGEQCAVVGGKKILIWGFETPSVRLKKGNEVSPAAMRNPSDPDAAFNRHKGQGYNVSIIEKMPPVPADGGLGGPSFIAASGVAGADVPDREFVPVVRKAIGDRELGTKKDLADGACPGQEDCENFRN
jgi:hypothetical protein